MWFGHLILVLALFKNSYQDLDNRDLINFIAKFLQFDPVPAKIYSFLCWNKEELLEFSKILWLNNYPLAIANVDNITFSYDKLSQQQLFILDLRCTGAHQILETAEKINLFGEPFRWIVVGRISEIMVGNFSTSTNSKFFVIEESQKGTFQVSAMFKNSKESSNYFSNDITRWNKHDGFEHFNELLIGRNRSNLNKTILKVSYVLTNMDSLNHLWDYRFKHIDTISKLNYILVHHLLDFVNASGIFILRKSWGYKKEGSAFYDGLMGDLQTGVADFGGTTMFFTLDRIDVVDFIAATNPTFMKFLFRAPPLSYVTNVYKLPFDTYLWYATIILLAIAGINCYIIALWEWHEPHFRSNIEDANKSLKANIFDVIIMQISAVSQQGSEDEPRSISGRISTIFLFIACVFLYTSYSANIVVLLQSTTDSIKSLQDLLSFRIQLGVEDLNYAHYYFETATESTRKAIYDQKIAPKGQKPNFMPLQEGIKRMREEFFGFHTELSNGYKIIEDTYQENEKCNLQEVTFINLIEPWLPISKKSSYKEILKIGMRRIQESGIQKREARKLYTKKPACQSKGGNFGSVGLIDCYFAFVIFGAGVATSLLILFLEVIMVRYKITNHIKVIASMK